MNVDEAAVKFNVGASTIKIWYELNFLSGFKIGEDIYIPVDATVDVDLTQRG